MLPRHRWAVVFGSIVFIAIVEGLSDTLLDPLLPFPFDTLLVVATVAGVAVVAAWFAFRLIDRLMGQVLQRHQDLLHRNATLRAVYEISLGLAGQRDPNAILASIVEHARSLLRADGALVVLEGPNGEPQLRAWNAADGVLRTGPRSGAARRAGVSSRPARVASPSVRSGESDSTSDQHAALERFLEPGHRVGLQVDVGPRETCVGSLAVVVSDPRPFSESDVETLSALGIETGLALEAARLRDELKAVAVQRERERIAREMHDGLAQVLGYVNTKSQAVEELLAGGRVTEAGKQMAELASAARSLYVDVREAIFSLSPPSLPERGLAPALEEYTARFAESSKIAVRFQATPEARRVALEPEVGAEVFGVARESLTNVRKHAHAHRVNVELSVARGQLVLRIVDDGVGFDAETAPSGQEGWHFGLAGMRQRAETLGGQIRWLSRPTEAGSVVELRIPVHSSGRNGRNRTPGPPGGAADRSTQHQMVQSPAPTRSEAD